MNFKFDKLFLRQKIYRYSVNILNSFFISRQTLHQKFNFFLKKKFDFKYVLNINMARIGLYFILKLIVKKKNIILMSPFTIFDMINKILSTGAKPKFIDTYKYQPHISFNEIKKNYNSHVIAILVTHYHTCHPEIDKIKNFCNKKKIYLIEDCAIAFGGKFKKNYIGFYGDFSIFSFGLYKFISTPLGGFVKVKAKKNFYKLLQLQSKNKINFILLSFFSIKGYLIKLIINNHFLKWLLKKFIKIGIIFNFKLIEKIINNDPNPRKNIKVSKNLISLPSKFQIFQAYRQLKYLDKDRYIRMKNAMLYSKNIKNKKIIKPIINFEKDPIANYPIICKNKESLYKFLIIRDYDVSNHYYRDCSKIKEFKIYNSKKTLKNIDFYCKNVLCLPVYPGLSYSYIKKLSDEINNF